MNEDDDEGQTLVESKRKLPSYSADSINEKEVRFIPPGSTKPADGNLITYTLADEGFADIHFNFLIVDEAQYVKNLSGSYYNMLQLESPRSGEQQAKEFCRYPLSLAYISNC